VLIMGLLWSRSSEGEIRIAGPPVAPDKQFPWMVRITHPKKPNSTWCTGSLITNQHVLFAENCVYGLKEDANKLRFRLGSSKASGHHEERGVHKIYSHPKYDPTSYDHDIAIAKMDAPVEFADNIKSINMSSGFSLRQGQSVFPVGFTSEGLKAVNLEILDHETCRKKFASCVTKEDDKCRTVQDSHICTYKEDKDICALNSGGPLVTRNGNLFTQVGVISGGEGCAKEYPGVYADVGKHLDFINGVINP